MSATLVTPKTTSGGEIVRELVNSSDGQGLHFDGSGSINGTSNLALGSKYSAEFVINYTGSADNRLFDINGDTRFIVEFNRSGFTGKIAGYDSGFYEICDIPDDGVFHLIVTVDGSTVSAYINGNLAGTATKNNSTSINTVTQWTIGANVGGSGSEFEGTIYRARFYNRTLSADDVRTAFERSDVDFSSQYGSQTKLIDSDFNGSFDGWNTSNDWATQTNNSNAMQLVANAANQICRTGTQLTKGKRYRVTYTASAVTGSPGFSTAAATHVVAGVISAGTANSFEFTFPTTATSQYFYIKSNASGDAVTLDDISVVQIGCVSDYQTQWANPSQSLTVQDASGAADGTCSASGVSQVQPVVQGNLTSLAVTTSQQAAGVPADGQVLANSGKIQNSAWPALEVELSGGSASAAQLQVTADDGDKARLEVAGSTSSISGLAQGDAVLYATNNLQFGTNNSRTAKLTIDSSGQVNITGTKSFPETSEHPLLVKAGMANGLSNRYIKLQQTYTGSANDGIPIVWETNADGSNNKSYGYIRTKADGTVAIGNKAAGAAVAVGTALGTTEHLAINSTGQVNIGTGTAEKLLTLQGNDAQIRLYDTSGTNQFASMSSEGGITKFTSRNNTSHGAFRFQSYNGSAVAERMSISDTGLCTFANGIAFQSATTGSGTGVGYTLENYEYGTFTMGLSGTTATIPSGYETARYYRIGNLVWISWYSGAMTLASSAGNAMLTGLPFNVANNKANYSVFGYTHGTAVDGNSRGGYFTKDDTTMLFVDDGATTAASFIDGSSRYIMVTGVYETDDA